MTPSPSTGPSTGLGRRLAALLIAAGAAGGAGAQDDFDRAIMGGPDTGTYIKFAQDIGALSASCGLDVDVVESEGGFENFLAVRNRPFTQLGLSRSDTLEFFRTYAVDNPAIERIAAGMRIALPLYDEEVQLLADRDVEGLQDLDGRRVGIGPEGSGTFLTSSLVLDLAGVTGAERISIPFADMLDAFLADEIDAFFFVAGAPVALLQSPGIDAEAHHLVPITDAALRTVYEPTVIPAGTYDYQDEPLETVAAKAVLMTFDFEPERGAYHEASCRTVSDITHLVTSRLEQLREEGHPKWEQIDLAEIPPGWEVGGCAAEGLRTDYEFRCTAPSAPEVPTGAGDLVGTDTNRALLRQICAVTEC